MSQLRRTHLAFALFVLLPVTYLILPQENPYKNDVQYLINLFLPALVMSWLLTFSDQFRHLNGGWPVSMVFALFGIGFVLWAYTIARNDYLSVSNEAITISVSLTFVILTIYLSFPFLRFMMFGR